MTWQSHEGTQGTDGHQQRTLYGFSERVDKHSRGVAREPGLLSNDAFLRREDLRYEVIVTPFIAPSQPCGVEVVNDASSADYNLDINNNLWWMWTIIKVKCLALWVLNFHILILKTNPFAIIKLKGNLRTSFTMWFLKGPASFESPSWDLQHLQWKDLIFISTGY